MNLKTNLKGYLRHVQISRRAYRTCTCPACEAGRYIGWIRPGDVFLIEVENEPLLWRLQVITMAEPLILACVRVTRDEADNELKELTEEGWSRPL